MGHLAAGGGSEAREVARGTPLASAQASACDEAFPERALVGTYAGAQNEGTSSAGLVIPGYAQASCSAGPLG
jgi:hypothetical protein